MERRLADYDSDHDQYARPEQAWVCGRSCDGTPCYIGPDDRGHCQVHLECQPQLRDGRWRCTRPKAAGGKCEDGPRPDGSCPHRPAPCQPKRNVLARRRTLVVFTAAAALGGVLFFSAGESGTEFVSPGNLSVAHHGLEGKCTACHTAAEGHSVLAGIGNETALTQSFKCLDCHEFGDHALQAHSLNPQQVAAITKRMDASDFTANPPAWLQLVHAGPGIPQSTDGELACAVCHQEHRGSQHELTTLSDRRCQLCHTKPFHAFSKDHPEFVAYPYKRRMRIRFDHSNHYGRHFGVFRRLMPNGRKPESCTSCHTPDPSGKKMLVRGFEQSCGSCHAPEIESENVLPGLAFFQLPGIDAKARDWPDVDLGDWPRFVDADSWIARGGPAEQLPPFMRLLLTSDPNYLQAVRALTGRNLSRLDNPDDDVKQAVRQYLETIRRLRTALLDEGEAAVRTRLRRALPGRLSRETAAALTGPRSGGASLVDALRLAEREWSAVSTEKPAKDKPPGEEVPAKKAARVMHRLGCWTIDREEFAIRYRPSLHADPFLRAWLDLCCDHAPADAVRTASSSAHLADGEPSPQERSPTAVMAALFVQLTDAAAPGSCVKCHTVDRRSDGRLQINWRGYRTRPYQHRFTKFSHQPHLKELGTEGCAKCHVRSRKTAELFQQTFTRKNGRPNASPHATLTSGFQVMHRSDCATCHTPKLAGESCLKCHNYHIGNFPPR